MPGTLPTRLPGIWKHEHLPDTEGALQPVFLDEALLIKDGNMVPFVPGRYPDGGGTDFSADAISVLGVPFNPQQQDEFNFFLERLLVTVRNYNHWLYMLRRAHFQIVTKTSGPPKAPEDRNQRHPPEEELDLCHAETWFKNSESDLFLHLENYRTYMPKAVRIVFEPIRINDYIVSVRLLVHTEKAGDDLRKEVPHSSSSHTSVSSAWSSSSAAPPPEFRHTCES